jgi:hypothetical protein
MILDSDFLKIAERVLIECSNPQHDASQVESSEGQIPFFRLLTVGGSKL